jgi:hypothetical protein
MENFRSFEARDPFGRTWQVEFLWQQNAISIRHSDSVDVKFSLECGGERQEKVIALPHPVLLALSAGSGRLLTDPWCAALAASQLAAMIATWTDMDKTVVTPAQSDLEHCAAALH